MIREGRERGRPTSRRFHAEFEYFGALMRATQREATSRHIAIQPQNESGWPVLESDDHGFRRGGAADVGDRLLEVLEPGDHGGDVLPDEGVVVLECRLSAFGGLSDAALWPCARREFRQGWGTRSTCPRSTSTAVSTSRVGPSRMAGSVPNGDPARRSISLERSTPRQSRSTMHGASRDPAVVDSAAALPSECSRIGR